MCIFLLNFVQIYGPYFNIPFQNVSACMLLFIQALALYWLYFNLPQVNINMFLKTFFYTFPNTVLDIYYARVPLSGNVPCDMHYWTQNSLCIYTDSLIITGWANNQGFFRQTVNTGQAVWVFAAGTHHKTHFVMLCHIVFRGVICRPICQKKLKNVNYCHL